MKIDRYNDVKRVFNVARGLSVSERNAYLELVNEPEICNIVGRLLAAELEHGSESKESNAQVNIEVDPYGLVGTLLAGYLVEEVAGKGAMGITYKARCPQTGLFVAIKLISPSLVESEDIQRKFLNECRIVQSLSHTYLASALDFGVSGAGFLYLVTYWCDGVLLSELIELNTLSVDAVLTIIQQLTEVVAYLHRQSVFHCDLKPSNIIVKSDGNIVLIDFGVAQSDNFTVVDGGHFSGTVSYMSPERLSNEIMDQQADLWSVGVIGYEMIMGMRPFSGQTAQSIVFSILNRSPQPIPIMVRGVYFPQALRDLLLLCISHDRDSRPDSCASMVSYIQTIKKGEKPAITTRAKRRKKVKVALSIASVLVVSITVGLFLFCRPAKIWFMYAMPGQFIPLPKQYHIVWQVKASGVGLVDGLFNYLFHDLERQTTANEDFWVLKSDQDDIKSPVEIAKATGANLVIQSHADISNDEAEITVELYDGNYGNRYSELTFRIGFDTAGSDAIKASKKIMNLLRYDSSQIVGRNNTDNTSVLSAEYLEALNMVESATNTESVLIAIGKLQHEQNRMSGRSGIYTLLADANRRMFFFTKESQWLDEAKKNANTALEINIESMDARIILAKIFRDEQEYGVAESVLLPVLETDYTKYRALRILSNIYQYRGNLERAQKYLDELQQLRPNYYLIYADFGRIYFAKNNFLASEANYRRAINIAPGNAWLYSGLASALEAQGKMNEAVIFLRKSIEIQPNSNAYIALGYYYLSIGEYFRAEKSSKSCTKLPESDHRCWANLARAYEKLHAPKQTRVEAWTIALKRALIEFNRSPRTPRLQSQIAVYYAELGQVENAKMIIKGVDIDLVHDNYELLTIALALYLVGSVDESLEAINRAIDNGIDVAEIEKLGWFTDIMHHFNGITFPIRVSER